MSSLSNLVFNRKPTARKAIVYASSSRRMFQHLSKIQKSFWKFQFAPSATLNHSVKGLIICATSLAFTGLPKDQRELQEAAFWLEGKFSIADNLLVRADGWQSPLDATCIWRRIAGNSSRTFAWESGFATWFTRWISVAVRTESCLRVKLPGDHWKVSSGGLLNN